MRWWHRRSTAATSATRPPELLPLDWYHKLDRLQIGLARPVTPRPGSKPFRRESAHGLEVHTYRPYTWGDDLRHLDWNAYARLDQPLIRRFRAEQESLTYVFVDVSQSMSADPAEDKLAFARTLAAGLAYVCLRRHEPIQIGAFSSALPEGWALSARWRQRPQFLSAIRFLSELAAQGGTDFGAAAAALLHRNLPPGLVIFLSDFLVPLEQVTGPLRLLRARGLAVAALQLLADSDREPFRGGRRWRLRDAESGEEREVWWDETSRALYREALERHVQALRDFSTQHGVLHVVVPTANGIERCFLETLVQARLLC